jgi:phosphoribosylformimino-5-aminoimidazole carboxamide ribotide isomerase
VKPGPIICILQADLELVARAGRGRVDITVGSALDIFGGQLAYADVAAWHKRQQQPRGAVTA